MPIITENIKNYFEILMSCSQNNVFNDKLAKDNLKDMEINGLFPECYVEKGLIFIDEEFKTIKVIPRDQMKRSPGQSIKSLELMGLIYQLHGCFRNELNVLKYYQKLCDIKQNLEDKNFGLASEAFWHMVHDNKVVIPSRSVELCKKIVINEHFKKLDHRFFIVDFAKIMFKTINPDYDELLENIQNLRKEYQEYFDRSSLDSYLSRALISYYTFVVQTKAERLNAYVEYFNHLEAGQVMRKVALKVLDHLKRKNSNITMLSGSYETLFYMWTFVNILLISLHMIAEVTTIMGLDREAKQYQYEYFRMTINYCVPFRTKSAIKLMMHNEFISLRIPELTIRDAQLYFLKTNDTTMSNSMHGSYCCQNMESEMDEFNLPMVINDYDFFGTNIKTKTPQQPHQLYITSSSEGEKILNFEDCYLAKSIWKVEFLEILKIIRTHIWKTNSNEIKFSDDNQWENLFLAPKDNEEKLSEDFKHSTSLITPENSPSKSMGANNKCAPINAPIRVQRRQMPMGPTKIRKQITKRNEKVEEGDDGAPIDGCSTVLIPYKARNIRYEIPELPRSIHYDESLAASLSEIHKTQIHSSELNFVSSESDRDISTAVCLQDNVMTLPDSDSLSLIDFLQKHINYFKFFQIPILHRPVFQRLALHYLSLGDQLKAAHNFSLAINIGFRQSYQYDCSLKIRLKNEDSKRWLTTLDTVTQCLVSESNLHSIVREILPNNWTVLQFTMLDEIYISKIKSSLLDGAEGGCLGARNVSLMVATKYQKVNEILVIESKVIHGFKTTGLQLMEVFEKLKMDNITTLNISERHKWWKKRYEIDSEMNSLVNQMRKDWLTEGDLNWLLDNNSFLKSEPKIIIADRHLGRIPWECIFMEDDSIPRCFSRMPNLICLVGHLTQIRYRKVETASKIVTRTNLEIDPCNAFFVINPDSTLKGTEDSLLPMFKERLKWDGISGQDYSTTGIDCSKILNIKDMTIYCGHGSGSRYLVDRSIKQLTSPSAMFLIGCYSARFIVDGRSEALALMMNYLGNGCPSVLGLMWDVTDREIDRYTRQMFSGWLSRQSWLSSAPGHSETYDPVAPLSSYVYCRQTTDGLRLRTLTGKAPIIYGLPIWVDDKSAVPDLTL